MLQYERFQTILKMLEEKEVIKVSDIKEKLDVTNMTIRRDLKALEEKGLLTRIHGGAKRKENTLLEELSHNEKKSINIEEKKYVAKIAANLIEENDIVFIGPGTTNELIYDYINVSYAKIVTNSISVFSKFADDKRFELILVGGRLRSHTGTFIGSLTNEVLKKIRVKKAFIGTNGIYRKNITTFNEEEGVAQKIILDNAFERYILADSSKVGKVDFYSFYELTDVTAVITDNKIDPEIKKQYEKFVKIINE